MKQGFSRSDVGKYFDLRNPHQTLEGSSVYSRFQKDVALQPFPLLSIIFELKTVRWKSTIPYCQMLKQQLIQCYTFTTWCAGKPVKKLWEKALSKEINCAASFAQRKGCLHWIRTYACIKTSQQQNTIVGTDWHSVWVPFSRLKKFSTVM